MNVRALLLVAGRGSRLGALGADKPKCLAVLAGRSLLEWKLRALAAAGIDEIHALTGYQAQALEQWALPMLHNPRWAETNMVGTLLHGEALRRPGRSLICYGDIVVHPDVLRSIASAEGDIVIPYDRRWLELWRARFADPLSDAETLPPGARLPGRDRTASNLRRGRAVGQFMGLLAVTPQGGSSCRRWCEH
ncbi:MAG: NTP transferase domain-containing protein [Burkholderiales bacterium]|nr:NTP transferase domain-containing protein [Burkholderiales bacterium]